MCNVWYCYWVIDNQQQYYNNAQNPSKIGAEEGRIYSNKYVCNDNYDTLATVHMHIDIIIA